jgi:hypothetical protein
MALWQEHYGADLYVVKDSGSEWSQDLIPADVTLARLLHTDPFTMVEIGLGTDWYQVESMSLDPFTKWFVQGDPWTVLLGVSHDQVLISALSLSNSGLAGPGTLEAVKPQLESPIDNPFLIVENVKKIRRSMQRRWRRCEHCQSPRLDGCTCIGPATGLIVD